MTYRFQPLSNPILILSDSAELLTGLARIGRDLATLLSSMPQFRVGYAGMHGRGRRRFPWAQYSFPDDGQFGAPYLPGFWHDFAGEEQGVILSAWDLSRMLWFGQPGGLGKDMESFLGDGRGFAKWGYVPLDSTGPDEDRLPTGVMAAAAGYDRLLAASQWGQGLLSRSGLQADWLPHGIWIDKFHPIPDARKLLGWDDSAIVLGCNMSNQSRKDWAVAFECARQLRLEYGARFHFWAHTDVPVRYWNFYALAADYGVKDCLEVTLDQTDEQLALRYSACDSTILPSAGEGFGYPIAESMACGTPCIVTDYAAGQELVDEDARVPAMAYRVDTVHNVRRAVLSGYGFAARADLQIRGKREDAQGVKEQMVRKVEHLDWRKLQHPWKKWLLRGIGQ